MKRMTILVAAAILAAMAAGTEAKAQQSYTYNVVRTRNIPINWRPEEKTHERYTVSVSPLRLMSNGLKFDFEVELPKPGHWFGTGLTIYLAPERRDRYDGYWNDGNNRSWFNSSWDNYSRMWGLGTSAIFKNTFSRRGWYFATGITFEFFRVGVNENDYVPYQEDGLTFYDYRRTLDTKSYFKPTAQIVIGKHMALSERCYFDLYAGLGVSYAFYKKEKGLTERYDGYYYYPMFSEIGGFAYRGLLPVGGFRFGVLLWKPKESEN